MPSSFPRCLPRPEAVTRQARSQTDGLLKQLPKPRSFSLYEPQSAARRHPHTGLRILLDELPPRPGFPRGMLIMALGLLSEPVSFERAVPDSSDHDAAAAMGPDGHRG